MILKAPLHLQNINGKSLPKVEISDLKVSFDPKKISISIWGGFLADIGDLFIGLFKKTIINIIGSQINTKVPGQLNEAI